MNFPAYRRIAFALLQAAVVVWVCASLSPLNTQTVLSATSEYVLNQGFGPYDRIVFSHVHQRPFEICKEADALHVAVVDSVAKDRPAIDASSRYEIVRVLRLVRDFNRKSQTFYSSRCAGEWSYFYSYVDYQSSLMKVAPAIYLIDVLHRSEIYIVVAMILGSWFGIFSLFWIAKRLTGSMLVGFASLGALWYGLNFFGPGLYADSRLNLLNSFALVAVAQFLCAMPHEARRGRRWAIELSAALLFAAYGVLLTFPRLPSTRLDATVVMICLFAVAVIRLDRHVLRRAVLVLVVVTAVLWPYKTYSAGLLGPVGSVNSAEAYEYKTVNAVQFLTERPGHFGNFILDFNFSWMFDGDYYLRELSPVQSLHHGYPAWGRKFLKETALYHFTEFPSAWWRRFLMQLLYHKEFSFGIYRGH